MLCCCCSVYGCPGCRRWFRVDGGSVPESPLSEQAIAMLPGGSPHSTANALVGILLNHVPCHDRCPGAVPPTTFQSRHVSVAGASGKLSSRTARTSKTSGRAVRFKPELPDSSKQRPEQTLETASAVAGVWRWFGNALYSTTTLERGSMIDLEDPETVRSARHAAREWSPHHQRLGGYTPGGRVVVSCDA